MKSTIFAAIALVAFVIVSNSNLVGGVQDIAQDAPPAIVQDAPPAVVQDAPPAVVQDAPPAIVQEPAAPEPPQPDEGPAPVDAQESPSDVPAVVTPVPDQYVPESVLQGAPMMMPAAPGCGSCCCQPCCCPPCPVPTTLCLIDPCTGCSYEVCVEVPPCCVGQQPVVSWRDGLFGRRIASLCWTCCDKQAKVTITRRGKVRVRG